MTGPDIAAILDPIQRQWLPMMESAGDPEWRAHYFRAAISEALIAGRQTMLKPLGLDNGNQASDPFNLLPAIVAAKHQQVSNQTL